MKSFLLKPPSLSLLMFRSTAVFLMCVLLCPTKLLATEPRFEIEVMSILSKAGCNAGTCHGNLNGKGGFKLSLRGQDAEYDYASLVQGSRGRRVNFVLPAESLMLQKAIGTVPHRGGIRFDRESAEYEQLNQWLQLGAVGPKVDSPRLANLQVSPSAAVVRAPEETLQISVRATYSDGSSRDVTSRACYELSNLDASVSADGEVKRVKFGETTLIVRYLNQQVAVPIAFIDPPDDFVWQEEQQINFVDHHVFSKLRSLSIQPSPRCDDSTYVRRAFLDAVGRLPTAAEARDFVANTAEGKRSKLVDALLERKEFSDYWALKFADILRVEEKILDPRGVDLFHAWIRTQLHNRVPHDKFVRSLVTGTGSTFDQPAANFYRANRDATTRGETSARLFLGTRLQCAKCHNHPFDRWTQDDYYRWSTLFSQIDYEIGDNKRKDKLDKNEFAGEQTVRVAKKQEVRNPTTNELTSPKFLGGDSWKPGEPEERLEAVAKWITAPENELFVKSQVNFVWYHMMGLGLVDPIDDFRLTNPASNPALLDALADHFVEKRFDIRALIRVIMLSRIYQSSSRPLKSNQHDETSYSRALVKRLPAEVLLDMQSDVLGTPASFAGYPVGLRAVQIPGVKRVRSRDKGTNTGDRFLRTFGKPERILACDCERSNETNLQQVLGLIGKGLNERIANSPVLVELANSERSDQEIVEQLYWSALSRPPTNAELGSTKQLFETAGSDRLPVLQDIAWAVLNAKEFLFRN